MPHLAELQQREVDACNALNDAQSASADAARDHAWRIHRAQQAVAAAAQERKQAEGTDG